MGSAGTIQTSVTNNLCQSDFVIPVLLKSIYGWLRIPRRNGYDGQINLTSIDLYGSGSQPDGRLVLKSLVSHQTVGCMVLEALMYNLTVGRLVLKSLIHHQL